jgi:hypothetical protein
MTRKRRSFKRISYTLDYRPLIIIATEGKKTEPSYFRMVVFKPPRTAVHVVTLGTKTSSSPITVLNRIKRYIKEYGIKSGDEAWIVVDKDNWKDTHLEQLYSWSTLQSNRGLAVSNPQFEYWLLLHFEDGNDVHNKTECLNKLKCHCPNYNKRNIPVDKFTLSNVKEAVKRAKSKDSPPSKWPTTTGTTVYRLVERILS